MIYTASFLEPNNKVWPEDRYRPAIYFNDPLMTVMWVWSVQLQEWVQRVPAGTQQIFEGHGDPTIEPTNPDLPALYEDLDTGIQWAWRTDTQVWY